MSTSDPTSFVATDTSVAETDLASSLTKEIERLANSFFSASMPSPNAVTPGAIASPGAIAPPHLGPNAANLGAGGASGALNAPPIPGAMHTLPLAAAPPPRESDLRAIPTQLSEQSGFSTPVGLAGLNPGAPDASGQTPYFLELAGMPQSMQSATSPSLPSSIPSAPAIGATPALPSTTSAPSVSNAPTHATPSYDFQPEVVPDVRAPGGMFEPNQVKRDFPILQERVHGRQIVWLDNAATTQKPNAVIERVSYFYEHENSNVHRAAHTLAARSSDAYEAARDKARRFLNASSSKEIVFVRGATEAINLVAQSWGRRNIQAGDEIVITWLEHHANIVPWQQLCCEKNARLRVAPVDDRGQVILDEYEKLLNPKTRLVSFTQVSNALGTVTPAREMIAMARRHGARVHLDGAQAVSHMAVDVQSLDCDFFSFSGHKIFAPTGIGVLFGKADVLENMPPWQGGGNMIADVTFEKTLYQSAPWRFEAGTGNIADAVGLGAALDYVTALGLENIHRYEHELRLYAEEQLVRIPGLQIIGNAAEKAGVISFVLDGVRTEDVGGMLDQEGIAVRSGHHCAQPILRRFGLEATVRASLAPYNTREDIDALVAAVRRIQTGRPPKA